MEFGGASSLVLLLAVGLWIAYLVPAMVRRQNALAAERNAVRLQETLRALAETAELPERVRVESTGREVAQQRRQLRRAQRAVPRDSASAVAAAGGAVRSVPAAAGAAAVRAGDDRRQLARLRRGRTVAAVLLATGIAAAGGGLWQGLSSGQWGLAAAALPAAAVVPLALGAGMLLALARRAAALRAASQRSVRAVPAAVPEPSHQLVTAPIPLVTLEHPQESEEVAAVEPVSGWTPVALPKPLYLSRVQGENESEGDGPEGPGPGSRDRRSELAALREAAARSEQAIRDAHRAPGVATFGAVASASGGSMTELPEGEVRQALRRRAV